MASPSINSFCTRSSNARNMPRALQIHLRAEGLHIPRRNWEVRDQAEYQCTSLARTCTHNCGNSARFQRALTGMLPSTADQNREEGMRVITFGKCALSGGYLGILLAVP